MTERPILFKGAMVKAILDGTNTQTRRVVKPQPWSGTMGYQGHYGRDEPNGLWWPYDYPNGDGKRAPCGDAIRCPYGKPGDHLWVRETWMACAQLLDYQPAVDQYGIIYKADPGGVGDRPMIQDRRAIDYFTGMDRWRPSIHMPRWASRIDLEVTAVRVERLQDISEEDAKAEGVEGLTATGFDERSKDFFSRAEFLTFSATEKFRILWNSINAGRGYGWDVNPFVWVVDFKRIRP